MNIRFRFLFPNIANIKKLSRTKVGVHTERLVRFWNSTKSLQQIIQTAPSVKVSFFQKNDKRFTFHFHLCSHAFDIIHVFMPWGANVSLATGRCRHPPNAWWLWKNRQFVDHIWQQLHKTRKSSITLLTTVADWTSICWRRAYGWWEILSVNGL